MWGGGARGAAARGAAARGGRGAAAAGAGAAWAAREHRLRDGACLEVLEAAPSGALAEAGAASRRPPLVFLHGSYHAAWAWQNFMGRFAARGFRCYAPSFRGHGASAPPRVPGDALEGSLEGHATDVLDLLEGLGEAPPVLVGHSFGGLIAQLVATWGDDRPQARGAAGPAPPPGSGGRPQLAGLVLLNSVPPTGNGAMTKRFLLTRPLDAWRVTMGFIRKTFADSAAECRYLFFSDDLPDADLERYQALIASSAQPGTKLLDLRRLRGSLPIQAGACDLPPVLVVGSADDRVVDRDGILETAAHFGLPEPVFLAGAAHDSMLDTRWDDAADALEAFLDGLPPP